MSVTIRGKLSAQTMEVLTLALTIVISVIVNLRTSALDAGRWPAIVGYGVVGMLAFGVQLVLI